MRTTASREQHAPNMPTPNPWLADGPYPTSHFNGGATDSVALAGPTHGRKLKAEDVKTVPIVFDSNPAVKKVGKDTIAFASGAVGIQEILLTDKAFDPINFVVYPGFEKQAARGNEAAIKSVLAQFDAARRSKDDAKILAAVKSTEEMGMNFETGINGVYNLFDRDGYHYCVYGGSKVLKSFDGNDPRGAIKIVKTVDVAAAMPPEAAKAVKRIIGLGMTYDGYLAAAARRSQRSEMRFRSNVASRM